MRSRLRQRSSTYVGAASVLALTVLVLLIPGATAPWAVALLAIPPLWLALAFVGAQRARAAESRRRAEAVEVLNTRLGWTVDELSRALDHVRSLQGLLPICMHCKRIRDDEDTWHRLEAYLVDHSEVRFTDAVCGKCSSPEP